MFCIIFWTGEAFLTLYPELLSGFASFESCISAQHACIPAESGLIPLYTHNLPERNAEHSQIFKWRQHKNLFSFINGKESLYYWKKKKSPSPLLFGIILFFLLYSIIADWLLTVMTYESCKI